MAEPSVEQLQAALRRHASGTGEVFPSGLRLIEAEEHWSGRLWEVTRLLMADHEGMRFLAGGNRAEEVATCAAGWSDSILDLEQIKMVFAAGGYDPEPFESLERAGLLFPALHCEDGSPRIIAGERAGTWISDTFALSDEPETVEGVRRLLSASTASA